MYKNVLFDLDGTLTEPAEGITNSVAYALRKFGIEEERRKLLRFIGPPLRDSFMEYYGFSEQESELAVAYYREYFRAGGIFENRVYDGIEELLDELKREGKTIVLATSKPEEFAAMILEHFDLMKYFDFVAGATMDETRNAKADVIRYALEKAGIADARSAVMVGDRKHDVMGARENGLNSIGVLYGYGDRKELEAAGATYIVETVTELRNFLG